MRNSITFPHLLKCNLLRDLQDAQKAAFIDGCTAHSYKSFAPVLQQGEMATGMVIVAEGSVEVAYLNEDGNQTIIYLARAGVCLGHFEAVANRPIVATCRAFPGTTVLRCSAVSLDTLLKSPIFLKNFASEMCDLVQRDNRLRAVHQFYSSEQRICDALFELSEGSSELRLSQSYLAGIAGCSRQTVNRELGALRKAGIVEHGKGRVTVLDRDGLTSRIYALEEKQLTRNS